MLYVAFFGLLTSVVLPDCEQLTKPESSATSPPSAVACASAFGCGWHALIGVGGLVSYNWAPDALDARYGGDQAGGMAFVRLKIG